VVDGKKPGVDSRDEGKPHRSCSDFAIVPYVRNKFSRKRQKSLCRETKLFKTVSRTLKVVVQRSRNLKCVSVRDISPIYNV